MRWRAPLLCLPLPCLVALAGGVALGAGPLSGVSVRDLHFGEALYHAHQSEYFEALERLDAELGQHYGLDEPSLDSLYHHLRDAEFSVGDFELRYRMHHRAGRAITAVLEGAVDEAIRNDAAYRLARIHFQKGQPEDALEALQRIEGRVPEDIRGEVEFLRANIHLGLGRPAEAADILRRLQSADRHDAYTAYNLGIALLQDGRGQEGLQQLARAGQVNARDEAAMAMRDRSNLVRGTLLLEGGEFEDAKRALDRVRLEGPFSNRALLSAGWADLSAENYERALVPWSILAERERTDASVQEAMLALPHAYGLLDVHGRAALLYGQALESFDDELDKLDASIDSIRQGKFLEALVREEIRQDRDWVVRLRNLPEAPETYYLTELLASHDFQTALQNYLDLEDLRVKLAAWYGSFDAFDDVIDHRRRYYQPRLPEIDAEFRELDSRMRLRLEQHKLLRRRLHDMLTAPRPELLATAEEQALSGRLERLQTELSAMTGPDAGALQERARRLQGRLTWHVETEYHERLTRFGNQLRELDEAIEVLSARYEAFVRGRQAATHSYEGYSAPIARLRTRVGEAIARVSSALGRQGHMLELVAIDELAARRDRLQGYRDEARYALADSYDRATQAQARATVESLEPVEGE